MGYVTCVVWPSSLPFPERSFNGKIDPPLSGGGNSLGANETIRTHTYAAVTGTAELILDADQYIILQDFYRDDLNDGAIPFNADWVDLIGYPDYRAKLPSYKIQAMGAAIKVMLNIILVPKAHNLGEESTFEDDEDEDEDVVNPPSCSGFNSPVIVTAITPIGQNGASYPASNNTSTGASHSPVWDASSDLRIYGNSEVSSAGLAAITQPTTLGVTSYTYNHRGSIAANNNPSAQQRSGFYTEVINNPADSGGTSVARRTFIDNGCCDFETVMNIAMTSVTELDAYIDITMQFLGEWFNVLDEYDFPRYSGNLGSWTFRNRTGTLPPGTRYIRYYIVTDRGSQVSTSTYAIINNLKTAYSLPSA